MFKGVPETKIDVAAKVFGVKYHTLWRWETYGVPDRKLSKVDAILCKMEKANEITNPFIKIERHYGLRNPYGFKARLSRLFPGLWKEVKEGENK